MAAKSYFLNFDGYWRATSVAGLPASSAIYCAYACTHSAQAGTVSLNAALISPQADRERAEAAMIFSHKPPCNTQCVDSFPFDTTTISTSGKNALLRSYSTISPAQALRFAGILSQPRW
jgi:hypothetical protein